MIPRNALMAGMAYMAFNGMATGVTNQIRAAREFTLNSVNHDRTFRDMNKVTGRTVPDDIYNEGYQLSALDILSAKTDKGFELETGTHSDDTFSIRLYHAQTPLVWTELKVTGDTRNGDFFDLAKSLDRAKDFAEARKIFADTAPVLLGNKLVSTKTSEEFEAGLKQRAAGHSPA